MMDTLAQDLRYALRQLRARPGFTAIAVLTLAVGIGANSTLFSIVNAVLLRPLPYPESERIASVSRVVDGVDQQVVAHPEFLAWEGEARSFERLAAYAPRLAVLTSAGDPAELRGAVVSGDFFPVFHAQPVLGRVFSPEERAPGGSEVVLLSHGLWVERFGAAPGVLGRTITLAGQPATVIGVLPPGFTFPGGASFWTPLRPSPPTAGVTWFWLAIGRLRPGVSLEQASAELAGLQRAVRAELPEFQFESTQHAAIRVLTLHERLYGDARPALLMLLGAVAFVLLIACANVANLLLASAAAREREFAIRAALGAGRGRIVRQLLVESVLLALLGGGLGLLVPLWGIDVFVAVSPASVGRVEGIHVDGAVLAFTLAAALITGVLFGLTPALAASRAGLQEALREGGTRAGGAGRHGRLRRMLVVGELATALVLLIGAGLMLQSFMRLTSVDLGFRPDRVLAVTIYLPGFRYPDGAARNRFFEELIDRVRTMPGVEAAALGNMLPLDWVPTTKVGDLPPMAIAAVDPGYLGTLGIPLQAGRHFTPADRAEAPAVAIVSATLAHAAFPGLNPLGQELPGGERATIVGVAQDVARRGLDIPAMPQVYRPLQQWGSPSVLFVRSVSEPMSLVDPIRRAVREIDPEQPLSRVTTMERELAESVAPRRFNALLLGLSAGVALALAALGLYGVTAHLVTQRTHEIGVRMALGARQGDVMRLVVRQAMGLVAIGTVLGLGLALGVTRVVRTLLYQVSPTDPLTFASVPVLLAAVAGLASWLPARRATRVDPMVALRTE